MRMRIGYLLLERFRDSVLACIIADGRRKKRVSRWKPSSKVDREGQPYYRREALASGVVDGWSCWGNCTNWVGCSILGKVKEY
jgi:hypothetical protein